MKLKVLNSDSSGNGYILESENSALIIEAGVRLSKVKEALDFNISKVEACIVSHIHGDHAKYIREYLNAGIRVYSTKEVFEKHGLTKILVHNHKLRVGEFRFQPFKVIHDVECYCFLIFHEEMGLACFVTDTHYLPYKFKGLNQMIIEANYDLQILDENVLNGRLLPFVRNRIINSHMSLDTAKGILVDNDLKTVNKIVLVHLSRGNSNEKDFVNQIQSLTGKTTYAASKGLEIDFNRTL